MTAIAWSFDTRASCRTVAYRPGIAILGAIGAATARVTARIWQQRKSKPLTAEQTAQPRSCRRRPGRLALFRRRLPAVAAVGQRNVADHFFHMRAATGPCGLSTFPAGDAAAHQDTSAGVDGSVPCVCVFRVRLTSSMSIARTLSTTSSSAAAGMTPGWSARSTPSRSTIKVGMA